ncbi:hypothetical protein KP509_31G020400 [Ceratopteris richardii]|uniref:Bifunctional inhibitor/plant lipid transfer protein/seed storage helical domain-containing protein n=1 Tax=Ceratopteris richardii TaxID=49495 RepID=A0A8T2QWR6_CERRI|nr:hypothetical protein KP509_31G020400 [Ceratopteris richardii]
MAEPRRKMLSATAKFCICLSLLAAMAIQNTQAREAYCKDQNQALNLVLPCVTSGTVQELPSKLCCQGVQNLVSKLTLNCMCEILIAVGGPSTKPLVNNYVRTCSLKVPPNFQCSL